MSRDFIELPDKGGIKVIANKEKLHKLIEELPEEELAVAERFLRYLYDMGSDPLMKALHKAPEEDEQVSSE